jgi:hypothetical protein
MSLLTSVNQVNSQTSLFVEAGTGATTIPSVILNIDGNSTGAAYVRATDETTGSLHLGANPLVFDNIVCSAGPSLTTINTNLVCAAGLGVNGASVFTQSISLENQQVQNNLRYTQSFGPIADSTNDQPLGTAQPTLLSGSYAIFVQVTGNPQIQPGGIGYWNGTTWSGGANFAAHAYPGGGVTVGLRPAVGGASLVISNGSGAAISGFVYYTSLGEN